MNMTFCKAKLTVVTLALGLSALTPTPTAAQQPLSLEQYLDMETVSNPQISPDGTQIVYTRGWVDKINDRRQSSLHIMNADGSRPRHLLEGSGAQWSPDGTRILFTAPGEPQGSQIFVRWMDAEGAVTQVTRLERGPSNPVWSPDGEWIAFTSRVRDRADFAGVPLPARPEGANWVQEPKVVERAAYKRDRQGYVDTGWTHVFVVPAEGGTPRQLTDGDWNHSSIQWSPDGTEIYFTSFRDENADRPEHWQESEIYAVSVATGDIRQLTSRRGPDASPMPSPDGSLIAYTGIDAHRDTYRNQKIYLMSRDGSGSRVISGDYDRQSRGLMWAKDGSGLYFNVNRDGYRQLHFVSVDGGVEVLTAGDHLFALSSFSDDGVATGVISSAHEPGDIYRYGTEFANAINHDYPGADFPDLMKGVDEMLARGYVDGENLFVYGCSGGGILTSYIVGNTDRFRAASANCPIVNWMSAMGTSDAITYLRTFEKPFWEDPTEWIDRSSIFYVGNVTTPTMFLTGERDLRTPMAQTEEFYQALQYVGVPTVMIRFPDEWHGTSSRPSNFLRTQLYLRKWFEKWGTHAGPMTSDGSG